MKTPKSKKRPLDRQERNRMWKKTEHEAQTEGEEEREREREGGTEKANRLRQTDKEGGREGMERQRQRRSAGRTALG